MAPKQQNGSLTFRSEADMRAAKRLLKGARVRYPGVIQEWRSGNGVWRLGFPGTSQLTVRAYWENALDTAGMGVEENPAPNPSRLPRPSLIGTIADAYFPFDAMEQTVKGAVEDVRRLGNPDARAEMRLMQDFLLMLCANQGFDENLRLAENCPIKLKQLRQYIYPEWRGLIEQHIMELAKEQRIGVPDFRHLAAKLEKPEGGRLRNPEQIEVAGWQVRVHWPAPYLYISLPDEDEQKAHEKPFVYHAEKLEHAINRHPVYWGGDLVLERTADGDYRLLREYSAKKVVKKQR